MEATQESETSWNGHDNEDDDELLREFILSQVDVNAADGDNGDAKFDKEPRQTWPLLREMINEADFDEE